VINLKHEREKIVVEMKKLVDTSKESKREFTSEENVKFNELKEKVDRIDATTKANEYTESKRDVDSGFAEYLRTGNSESIRDLQSGSGVGANLVPALMGTQIETYLKDFNGFRQVATIIQTSNGQALAWPTSDDTGNIGELIAEGSSATTTSTDPTLAQVSLTTDVFSTKYIVLSKSLVTDSAFAIEPTLANIAGERLGKIECSTWATSILAAAGSATMNISSSTGIAYGDLVKAIHSVDPAYRTSPKFGLMFNDDTLKNLKLMKDSQNRPLWLPAVSDSEPATILGYKYWINQNLPSIASGNKFLLVGDFSKIIIRDVGGYEIMRDEYGTFAAKRQVGYVVFKRSGAKLVNTSAVKYVVGAV
jgi:HK97 family phage major capsid protein